MNRNWLQMVSNRTSQAAQSGLFPRLRAGVFFAMGFGVGWVAFASPILVLLVAALVPLWVRSPTRLSAMLLWLGYYLAVAHDTPTVSAHFFPEWPYVVGVLVWVFHACLLASTWALAWTRFDGASQSSAIARVVAILLVHVLPPIGLISWVSPWTAAGVAYPGLGMGGLALFLTLCVSVVLRNNRVRYAMLFVLIVAGVISNLRYEAPRAPAGWVGVNTQLGRYPDDVVEQHMRQQMLVRSVMPLIATGQYALVVLPEEVAGEWRPAMQYEWTALNETARQTGVTVLLGADVRLGQEEFANRLIVLGDGERGEERLIAARIPIPLGSWRWWAPSMRARPFAGGVDMVRGKVVAFSFCYEDFLAWPHIASFWLSPRRPEVMVSVANNWFGGGLYSATVQKVSVRTWARLYGVPLIRALNSGRP